MERSLRLMLATTAMAVGLAACSGGTPPEPMTSAASQTPSSAAEATVRDDLLKDWQNQKDTMVGIAEAMPEDKFDYKSTPAQRSFGEQVMHAASVNVELLKLVGGQTLAPTFTPDDPTTKAEILEALTVSYDYGLALLAEHTDAELTQTVDAGFLGPSTRARVVWFLLAHSMDVYGQMAVYLRLNDFVPPASGGGGM